MAARYCAGPTDAVSGPPLGERGSKTHYPRSVAFAVQTPVFDGPFDLLLHLILSEQVDIYEVSLSTIVDAYLAELDRMVGLDLEVATEFLLIAATLVELKTKRLLPSSSAIDLDEELGLWEERDLLLARLLECRTFKHAAVALDDLMARAERSLPRRAGLDDVFVEMVPDVLAGVTPDRVRRAYLRAIAPKPTPPKLDISHLPMVRVSVREAIDEVWHRMRRDRRATFRELTENAPDRLHVVVAFLAVLELYKQGVIEIDQAINFGDIVVEWVADSAASGPGTGFDAYEG